MASNRKQQSPPGNKQDTFQKLDEAYAESDMEDQLLVYWNRHKNQILTGLIAAIVIIIGFQLAKWWSQKSVNDRGQAYAAASGDLQKKAFADKFSSTDLGGIAYLELADKAYAAGDFSAAIPNYEKAFKAFDLVEFKQRAHLGLAISRLQAGDESVAIKDLESIGSNSNYPDVSRAEALYHLSVIDWKQGDFESMLERHNQIEELANAGNWQSKATQLQNTIPELRNLVKAKATEGFSLEN